MKYWEWLLAQLAKIKGSSNSWAISAPVLVALAVHFDHYWVIPVSVYVIVSVVEPITRSPQNVHIMFGMLFTLILGRWGLLAAPVFVLIEAVYDTRFEHDPFWWNGFKDTCYYLGGLGIGLIR